MSLAWTNMVGDSDPTNGWLHENIQHSFHFRLFIFSYHSEMKITMRHTKTRTITMTHTKTNTNTKTKTNMFADLEPTTHWLHKNIKHSFRFQLSVFTNDIITKWYHYLLLCPNIFLSYYIFHCSVVNLSQNCHQCVSLRPTLARDGQLTTICCICTMIGYPA